MAEYLLPQHDRGAPAAVNGVPMDGWTPDEFEAHVRFVAGVADRLRRTGECVDGQALSPDGAWVRSGGEPIHGWLEVRPLPTVPATVVE